jgi:C4-dicarboxylate-specific signal transduction histidine kinase
LLVVVTVDPAIRVTNSAAMERALINLFLNAAQAGERARRTSVEVRVSGYVEEAAVVLTVTDNGPGIPERLLATMFTTRSPANAPGRGLGLSIVEQFVRDYAGTLVAANCESGGAMFIIRFPNGLVRDKEGLTPNSLLAERITG